MLSSHIAEGGAGCQQRMMARREARREGEEDSMEQISQGSSWSGSSDHAKVRIPSLHARALLGTIRLQQRERDILLQHVRTRSLIFCASPHAL